MIWTGLATAACMFTADTRATSFASATTVGRHFWVVRAVENE